MSLAAGSAALLVALTACSSAGTDSVNDAEGGTLQMVIPADEGCVDPQQLIGRSQLNVARSMVDSLVFQEGAEFKPWLATEWEVSEDATTYTFTLRDDVTFSDGGALTDGARNELDRPTRAKDRRRGDVSAKRIRQ